ncbi:MAG: hypothetical protein PVF96_08385, partial [Candidatus Bathyarchaeota archaeon]
DFDQEAYEQGDLGYITVVIYNDMEAKIHVTELIATIDYYYTDGNTYLQTYFTDEELPIEILPGQIGTFNIPFSLPTNIAPGYTELYVKAVTELWNNQSENWVWSEHPTYRPILYIESPYKQHFENEQDAHEELQHQFHELQTINATTTSIMYALGIMSIAFALAVIFLIILNRRTRAIAQATL